MMRSSWMTSRAVLRSFVPCFLTQLTALGSVFCSMPLGLIAGRAGTPFNRAISARSSLTVCCNAASSASRRSVKASRSPRDRPEREIFSGADTPGKIGARQARRILTLLHTCPAFCPSYNGKKIATSSKPLILRRYIVLLEQQEYPQHVLHQVDLKIS